LFQRALIVCGFCFECFNIQEKLFKDLPKRASPSSRERSNTAAPSTAATTAQPSRARGFSTVTFDAKTSLNDKFFGEKKKASPSLLPLL